MDCQNCIPKSTSCKPENNSWPASMILFWGHWSKALTWSLQRVVPQPCTLPNFLVYLLGLCQQGGSYSQLFHTTHQLTPSTFDKPWRLIVYCDEIIPGNVLGRATRKCWCIYATFLEYGQHLSQEDAWLTLATERTSFVSQLDAGVSQMLNHVLLSIFCHPACNPTQGMLLPGPQWWCQIFLHICHVIGRWCSTEISLVLQRR